MQAYVQLSCHMAPRQDTKFRFEPGFGLSRISEVT